MKKILPLLLILILIIGLGAGGYYLYQNKDQIQEKMNYTTNSNQNNPDETSQTIHEPEEYNLERISEDSGLQEINETDEYVEEIEGENTKDNISSEQISNYQTYVTPDSQAVKDLVKNRSYEQIYSQALNWVWLADSVLNETEEKWLYPEIFLTQSPTMQTNPVQGKIASDCESQAYTLVSSLRSAGMEPEYVRVVTGQVRFGKSVGGHAWVEVFDEENNNWFQLEATSGNYYDSEKKEYFESTGLPYNYYQTNKYPSVQIWTYFNDVYFWDNARSEGAAPEIWFTDESEEKQPDKSEVTYVIPDYLKEIRNKNIEKIKTKVEKYKQVRANLTEEDIDNAIDTFKNENADQIEATTTNVQNKTIELLDTLEMKVNEGLTEEQIAKATESAEYLIKLSYDLIENSTELTSDQKAELNSTLAELEDKVETGLTQAEKIYYKNLILKTINQAENDIESGEMEQKRKDVQEEVKEEIRNLKD